MVPFVTFPNARSRFIVTDFDFSFLVEPNGFIQWDEHDHVSQKVVTADPGIDPKSVQAVLDFVRPIDDMMGPRTYVHPCSIIASTHCFI